MAWPAGPTAALAPLAALLLAGCGGCPYIVDGIAADGRAPVPFDLANATVAEEALRAMGLDTERDGLWVTGEGKDLEVRVTLDGGSTALRVDVDLDRREFRTRETATGYVREKMPAAADRINATVAALEAGTGWRFTMEPAAGDTSIC